MATSMTRRSLGASCVALALVMTGCAQDTDDATNATEPAAGVASTVPAESTAPPDGDTAVPAAPLDQAQLAAALPQLAQLPAGWSQVPSEVPSDECSDLGGAADAVQAPIARAWAQFNAPAAVGADTLGVEARSFPDDSAAAAWVGAARDAASACAQAPVQLPGGVAISDALVSPGQVPGDQAFATARTFTYDGVVGPDGSFTIVAHRGPLTVMVTSRSADEAELWVNRTLERVS